MPGNVIRIAAAGLVAAMICGGAGVAVGADSAVLIDAAINGSHRTEVNVQRDQYRHPKETLLFFGLEPDMTVVEITPGGGWYTEVLAPVLRGEGTYHAATYRITGTSPQYFRRMDANYRAKLEASPDVYDGVEIVYFDPQAPQFGPPGSADMVLTFRNVHNWANSGTAELMFRGFADVLKSGGILGVVEHRAKPGTSLEKQIISGYMTEDYVIQMARHAGFRLVARSEVNANDKDTTLHPGGVWNLLPNLRDVPQADITKMRAIGESDRMTLKFVKD